MHIVSEEMSRNANLHAVPEVEVERLRQTLARKLHPSRFTGMSGKMAAIVAFLLGEEWTDPVMVSLAVTSDRFVVSDAAFIGAASDLERNLINLVKAAELDESECVYLDSLVRAKVEDWRHE